MKKRKEWKIEELLKVQQNTNAWTLIFFALLQSTISLFFFAFKQYDVVWCTVVLWDVAFGGIAPWDFDLEMTL